MRVGSIVLALLALTAEAHAQTVVVPAGTGRPDADVAARLVEAAGRAGFDVLAGTQAAERTGLAPVGGVSADLKRDLGETAETVLELVASGESEQSVERGGPVLERAEGELVAIGSDAQAAQDLANLCLYLVRAELQQGGEDVAAARARACWRLVPDLPVDERLHPPAVRQVVQRVRADIDAGSTVLSLRAAPGEPDGCTILLNGRPVGETPEVRRAVVPGRYSVGTSCGHGSGAGVARTVAVEEGRVHRVLLHPRLETALRVTADGPWLVYAGADEAGERAAADAGELARLAELPEAIAAVREGARLRLSRVVVEPSAAPRVVGEATATSTGDDELRAAFERLRRGGTAVAVSDGEAGDSGPPIVGPVLLGTAGLGALAVLTVGLLSEGCIDEAPDGTCLEKRSLNTTAAVAYGAAGGAAVVGAVLWLVLGGGSDDVADERPVDVAVGLGNVDVAVSF